MKKETSVSTEQISDYIESKKRAFRQHQRDLPFGEKMRIAFSLAERDNTILRAVPLGKGNNRRKVWK